MSDPAGDHDDFLAAVRRRCDRIVSEAELAKKLAAGRPLRVKLGMDPTAPDVTLGHAVPLGVMRRFQDAGHKVVLIIGDATAMVGDPTGRNSTRPVLTADEVTSNAETYVEQVGKVLRTDEGALEIRRNSEWLGDLSLTDLIRLLGRKTLAQVLEREDFKKRHDAQQEIHLHELLYPLLQGWDSVIVKADIEFGGNDQLLNNLVGRDFQKAEGQEPQVVLTTPLLVGTDGKVKMSKSKGNYIALTDPPGGDGGMFGKVMSLPDDVMADYYRLVTDEAEADYAALIEKSPRDAKVRLAKRIVTRFHDAAAADDAERQFMTATHGGIPDDLPEHSTPGGTVLDLLKDVGFVKSNGEARRKIAEGGVRLDGEKVSDIEHRIEPPAVLQLGKKKFVKLVP